MLGDFDGTSTASLVRAVDMPDFVQSVLGQLSPLGGAALTVDLPGEKAQRRLVSDALARYRRLVASEGATRGLDGASSAPIGGDSSDLPLSRDTQLGEVTAYGVAFTGAMFGTPAADSNWTWRVVSVSVTGTDTAQVRYTAGAIPSRMDPGDVWRFKNPSLVYTKDLTFARGSDGLWRLSGWPNYVEFSRAVLDNVDPSRQDGAQDYWWFDLTSDMSR